MSGFAKPLKIALGLIVIAGLIVMPMNFNRYGLFILSQWAVMTIAAMGLNLTLGYAGQVSLAQGAFVGIGAYASAIMTTHGWPLPAAIAGRDRAELRASAGCSAIRRCACSTTTSPSSRSPSRRWPSWCSATRAGSPAASTASPTFRGRTSSASRPTSRCRSIMSASARSRSCRVAVWWLIRSPWGRAFMALRENPLRAQSLGIDTRRYTLMAFAIGSALGGVAGALYAPLTQYIDPVPFNLSLSLDLLMMVIVGGAGFFFGPFLGAMIAVLLPEWLRFTEGYYLMLYAIAVMGLLIWSPTGILGILDRYLAERRTKAASALRAVAKSRLETAQ